jgi:hypothetical protein
MRLFYQNTDLGIITDVGYDGPEVWASFTPNLAAHPFVSLWRFITDEANFDKDPPYPPEYLDDENWSVMDEQGRKRGIFLPAVYDDGAIGWRWRE